MTPSILDRLQEIAKLAEKATPGPWRVHESDDFQSCSVIGKDANDIIACASRVVDGNIIGVPPLAAAYIASVSPDVLLQIRDEVERLEQKNHELKMNNGVQAIGYRRSLQKIESLESENQKYRAALEEIAGRNDTYDTSMGGELAKVIAKEALGEKK